ncbi:MAG: Ig-like domain-containing protein, partial [bacterium]
MKTRILLSLLFILASYPFLTSSSCESDPTGPGNGDTDAPFVVQVSPIQNDTDVAVDATVTITFNEAMAAGSAAGHVTVSPGPVGALTWSDNKTLQVAHTNWPTGTQVTVTAGTGLTDAAGNGLAAAFAWSFWTATDAVILQNTMPVNGATGVPINSTVWLQFS